MKQKSSHHFCDLTERVNNHTVLSSIETHSPLNKLLVFPSISLLFHKLSNPLDLLDRREPTLYIGYSTLSLLNICLLICASLQDERKVTGLLSHTLPFQTLNTTQLPFEDFQLACNIHQYEKLF